MDASHDFDGALLVFCGPFRVVHANDLWGVAEDVRSRSVFGWRLVDVVDDQHFDREPALF
jgi:hypothetical protein